MKNIEKENKRLKVLIVILVIVLLGLGAYHYYVTYVNVNKNAINSNKPIVTDNIDNNDITSTSNLEQSEKTNKELFKELIKTNMTYDEIDDLGKKIIGNYANVKINDNFCSGNAIAINSNSLTAGKFNSDYSIYNILGVEKIDDTKFLVKTVILGSLTYGMFGPEATFSEIIIDISDTDNKLIISFDNGNNYSSYERVPGGNGEFHKQDYYCDWYKNNH